MELFSVVIPCYNCVNTLEATINSIRVCGLTDYEIVLVDDGSTDGTAELCDAMCGQYAEIRCAHQTNAGVSAARNRGIDEARGEYIWFVDADDTVDPGALSHAVSAINHQQPDMLMFGISFDYYYHGKLYRREMLTPPIEGEISFSQIKENFQEFYNCNALTTACNKFIRRNLLIQCGVRFREDMFLMEDFLFVLELLPYCQSSYSLKEPIYRYRQAEDEKGAYRRLQRITDLAAFMQPIADCIQQLNISDQKLMTDQIYAMLFRQSLAYAPLKQIRLRLALHCNGKYADAFLAENACKIWAHYRLSHMRHKAAVFIKSRNMHLRRKICS